MPRDQRVYITLDHSMPDHPKVAVLSDRAFRLLIESWCWCSRRETDGRIPLPIWTKLGPARARAELVAAGLIDLGPTHADCHDYLQHQRSADEIADLRAKRARAGAIGGARRAENLASAKASAEAPATASALAGVKQWSSSKPVAENSGTEHNSGTDLGGGPLRDATREPRHAPPQDHDDRCTRHPDGNPTDEPCAGCARVRERRDRAEERDRERRQQAELAARANCPDCEGTGKVLDAAKLPTSKRCTHPKARRTA